MVGKGREGRGCGFFFVIKQLVFNTLFLIHFPQCFYQDPPDRNTIQGGVLWNSTHQKIRIVNLKTLWFIIVQCTT